MEETSFGAWLKQARARRGLTLDALGDIADVSHVHISRMEKGVNNPSRLMVIKIAAALGIDPNPGLRAAGFLPEAGMPSDAAIRVGEAVMALPEAERSVVLKIVGLK
jgi:transcriptional regulator with XRE-family HTH domain